jgi:hypothetical protein
MRTEVIRSLSAVTHLQTLSLYGVRDAHESIRELAKWLKNNCTLTELMLDCDEAKAKASPSPLAALVEAVRSNPHSALTELDARHCAPAAEGAAALISLIELPRIDVLEAQAAVPYD